MDYKITSVITFIFFILIIAQNIATITLGLKKFDDLNVTDTNIIFSNYLAISGTIGLVIVIMLCVSTVVCIVSLIPKRLT